MKDFPTSLPFEMQNRYKQYNATPDLAFKDLFDHPEHLEALFQAIAGNQDAREASADWTHRFVERLIGQKAYPRGAAVVIRTLGSSGLLNPSEQVSLAIRAIETGMIDEVLPLLAKIGGIHAMLEGVTALHWACRHGQLNIAELLTEQGASWSRNDIHGEKPIDLLDQKNLPPETVDRFKELEATSYPPGITKEAVEIFEKYHEVKPEVVDRFFHVFVQDPMPLRQLTWLRENKPMVQLIFQQKYALTPEDPALVHGLAFCRRENIITENLADAMERYESLMTTRSVAHIIGDATILGRREDNTSLEGHLMSQTIPLLQATMGRVLVKYGDRLDQQTKELLKQIFNELTPAFIRSIEMESFFMQSVRGGTGALDRAQECIRTYTSKFLNELQQLSVDETVLLPWGWRGTKDGHAMLIIFTRTSEAAWTVKVLNTGAGIEFGPSMIVGGKNKFPFFTSFENVMDQELLDPFFLERLLEPQIVSEEIAAADLYQAILAKQIGHRQRKLTADEADVNDFITGQRSGTCAFRVLSSFMRLRLGVTSYKKFKHFMHLETAEKAFYAHREAFRIKPERRRLLQDGLSNIARQAVKLLKRGQLNEPEFRCSSDQIQKLQKEMDVAAPAGAGHSLKVGKSERVLGSRQVSNWMDKLTVPYPEVREELSREPASLKREAQEVALSRIVSPCKSAQELLERIDDIEKVISSLSYKDKSLAMANILLELPFPEETFIKSIQQLSIEDAKALMNKLMKTLRIVETKGSQPLPDVTLAFQMAYGLAYTIACHIDEQSEQDPYLKLGMYKPDPYPLQLFRKNPHVILGDPRLEDKALQLESYFKGLGREKKYDPLFSFLNWNVGGGGGYYGTYDSYSYGLELPPPRYSSEETYLEALKRRVGSRNPDYQDNCPKGMDSKAWYDARIFDQLTPDKAHIVHFRHIYLQSRLSVLDCPQRWEKPFTIGVISQNKMGWACSRSDQLPKLVSARRLERENSQSYNDIHRPLGHLDRGELQVLDRIPENRVCFRFPSELRSLFSIRSQSEVTLARLLQHFEDHLSDLEDPGVQEFFLLTLCHFGDYHLRGEKERNPTFEQRLRDFFEKRALPFCQQRLLSTTETDELERIGAASLFLLTTQGRVATYFDDTDMFQRSIDMLQIWTSRQDTRCPLLFKETPAHRVACQSLIQTLMLKPKWTFEEAEKALIAFASSVYCTEDEKILRGNHISCVNEAWNDPRREFDVRYAFWDHREELAEKLSIPEFRQRVLTAMIHETSLSGCCGEWQGVFPFFGAQLLDEHGDPKAQLETNIIFGEVRRDGVLIKQPRFQERQYFLYNIKNIIGQDVLDNLLSMLRDYPITQREIKRERTWDIKLLTFLKPDGQRLLTAIRSDDTLSETVEVDCRGRPFQTLSKRSSKDVHTNFPIRYPENEVIFAISADEGPRAILVMDRNLKNIGMLTHEGLWIKDPDDLANQPQPIAVNEKFEVEGPTGWERTPGGDPNHIILTRFDAAKKKYSTVEFKRDPVGGRLVWEGERGTRYYLSDDQTLAGMGQRTDYVILEDTKGKRKVYFLGKKIYEIDKLTNRPQSIRPVENARFAQYAMEQGEYVEAMHFLDQMTLVPVIGFKALKELHKIFSAKDNDANPNSIPLRIKAAHIAVQAMRNRPLLEEERRALEIEKMNELNHSDEFQFKEDQIPILDYWSQKRSTIGPPLEEKLITYFSRYFSVEANIDEQLKLSQCIGHDEVTRWLSELVKNNENSSSALINSLLALIDSNLAVAASRQLEPMDPDSKKKLVELLKPNTGPSLWSWKDLMPQDEDAVTDFSGVFPKLRPGKKFQKAFDFLYRSATEGSAQDKKQVQQVIDAMQKGADSTDKFLIAILEALLHPDRERRIATEIRGLVYKIRQEKKEQSGGWFFRSPNDDRLKQLQQFVKGWSDRRILGAVKPERVRLQEDLEVRLSLSGDQSKLKPLPTTVPPSVSERVIFNTTFQVAPFGEVRALVVEFPVDEAPIESLTPPPFESDYAKRRFEAQNRDYQKGQLLNRHPHYKIDDAELPGVIQSFREALAQATRQDLRTPFVDLANQVPPGSLAEHVQRMEKVGRIRTPLGAEDCILAFLREDSELLRRRNPHLSQQDADRVRRLVGEYLCHSIEVWRLRQCLERAEAIQANNNPAIRNDLVELFRQSLDGKCEYDPIEFPAFLVFEYYGSEFLQSFVRLQLNQVEGIKEMIQRDSNGSYPSLAIQRIMGAGKTFVFGTVMALLKADGYHLSIHVPPSALFTTNSSDMLQRVVRFFQQRGQAIHFTRAPEHFDERFLENFYRSLHNAVLNRNVILAAPETLLSLRNRYIEMRDRLSDLYTAGASKEAIEDVDKPLQILEMIIRLLRSRGVATLDEIDVTLAPNKEHNFPVGERRKLDSDANILIEKIFLIAATDPEVAPKLGLIKNHQSHLDVDQRKEICSHIARKILEYLAYDDKWKGRLLLWVLPPKERKAELEVLHAYLMDEALDPPPLLREMHESSDPLKKQLAEYLILLRKELRDWLPQGWQRNLQEHYGRSHKDPNYPLARPYMANNTPNETSEFADRWEMINRTFHTYLVEGLNKAQTRGWVGLLRKEAAAEWDLEGGTKGLNEVDTALAFEKLTGKKLYEFDVFDDSVIAEIQETLTNGTPESIKALLSYVRCSILDQVEMPLRQVSSNAQSLCSLFKTTQGYAGTMECADTFSEGIQLHLDEGTNGKTIDLLNRKKSGFHVLENESNLLQEVIGKHPHIERVHAIIDVGAYFRGQTNATVAREIAQLFGGISSKVKGVIYFDEENNWPTFIFNNDPDHPITLPAMDPLTISLATGLSMDEVFTYYDQRNITGVDIKQSFDAIAITTISENSSIREVLQGVGRMRGLHYSQEIEFVVTKAVVEMMKNKLAVADKNFSVNVHHLVVFTAMNETAHQLRYNVHSVILKLNNAAQEVVLEAIFGESSSRRKNALYTATRTLFTKVVEAELYALYAEKAKPIPTLLFLNQVTTRLKGMVRPLVTTEIAANLNSVMRGIVESAKAKKMLPATIDGSQAIDAGREATMEQEQTRLQEQERKQEQKKEVVQLTQDSPLIVEEVAWPEGVLMYPNFPRLPRCPKVEVLQTILREDVNLRSYAPLFDAPIDVTLNFRQITRDSNRLLTVTSKEPYIVLAILDAGYWRFMLGSLQDMGDLRKQIEADGQESSLSVYMINPNGHLITDGKGDWGSARGAELEDPSSQLSQGLIQIMVLQGNIKALSSRRWHAAAKYWISAGHQELKRAFIEKCVLRSPEIKESYEGSRFQQLVNAGSSIEAEDLGTQMILQRIQDQGIVDLETLQYYLSQLERVPSSDKVREGIADLHERIQKPVQEAPPPAPVEEAPKENLVAEPLEEVSKDAMDLPQEERVSQEEVAVQRVEEAPKEVIPPVNPASTQGVFSTVKRWFFK